MSTYVISDIHGQMAAFESLLELVGFSDQDHLYVLGDAIDRGDESIEVLMKIMHDPRMTMLMGNHEHMMYSKIHQHYDYQPGLWEHLNGGLSTFEQYQALPKDQQEEIKTYLAGLPLLIPDVEAGGRHFLLVHSKVDPNEGNDRILTMEDTGTLAYMLENYIWKRWEGETLPDRLIVAGHTPNRDGQIVMKPGYINIDCCAAATVALGMLRLDDLSAYYVEFE